MEFHNMGVIPRQPDITASAEVNHVYYPSITLSDVKLPGIKGKVLGDKCTLVLKAKVQQTQEADEWDNMDKGAMITFDILEACVAEEKDDNNAS